MKLLLPLTIACLLLAGCGQKGPLYKTPAKTPNQAQQPAQPTAQHSQ